MSIGYACITLGLVDAKLRKVILRKATDDMLREITLANLGVLDRAIDYNIKRGIKLFRISSDIIPFGSHPVNKLKWWDEYKEILEQIGKKISENSIRVSMHPGQYTVINSPDNRIVQNAIMDLEYHSKFLDSLGVDRSHKIILHIGGVYGDKGSAIDRFKKTFNSLSSVITRRVVIENDEKSYNLQDVLKIGWDLGIPVVYDNLHNKLNPSTLEMDEWELIDLCSKTWGEKDGLQKIHYSQQHPKGKPGAHSSTILIKDFMEFYNTLRNKDIDIMLEVKDKDISAIKCINSTNNCITRSAIEAEWGRYKYLVMEHSLNTYKDIRKSFKHSKSVDIVRFYQELEEALRGETNSGNVINAAQHVWGYFKKVATSAEKSKFISLIDKCRDDNTVKNSIKNYLLKLSIKYKKEYILHSYYFLDV